MGDILVVYAVGSSKEKVATEVKALPREQQTSAIARSLGKPTPTLYTRGARVRVGWRIHQYYSGAVSMDFTKLVDVGIQSPTSRSLCSSCRSVAHIAVRTNLCPSFEAQRGHEVRQ